MTKKASIVLLAMSAMASAAVMTLCFSARTPGQVLPAAWNVYAMSTDHATAHRAMLRDGSDALFSIDAHDASGGVASDSDNTSSDVQASFGDITLAPEATATAAAEVAR